MIKKERDIRKINQIEEKINIVEINGLSPN